MSRPYLPYFVEFFNILKIVICKFGEKRFLLGFLGNQKLNENENNRTKNIRMSLHFWHELKKMKNLIALFCCAIQDQTMCMTYTDGNLRKIILKLKIGNSLFKIHFAFGFELVKIWPLIIFYSYFNGLSLPIKKHKGLGFFYKKRGTVSFK